MHIHQYVQHDWSPTLWALMLMGLAITVFTVMALFLLIATRSYGAAPPRHDEATPAPPAKRSTPPAARVRHP